MNQFEDLKFSDEQRAFFNQRLREELQAAGHRSDHIEQTPQERAVIAQEHGDLDALKEPKIRAAFLQKFGINEFSKLHLRVTRERREKQRQAEEQKLIEQRKARTSQGRIGR